MSAMAAPPLPQCPAVPFTCPSPQPGAPRARFPGLQALLPPFGWSEVQCECVKCGFCVPSFRREVGLDLFFPKQMQENLKVREAEGAEPREPCSMCVLGRELEGQRKRIYGHKATQLKAADACGRPSRSGNQDEVHLAQYCLGGVIRFMSWVMGLHASRLASQS